MGNEAENTRSEGMRVNGEPGARRRRSTEAYGRDAVRYRTVASRRMGGFSDLLVDAPHRVLARTVEQRRLHERPRRVFAPSARARRRAGRRHTGRVRVLVVCALVAVALWASGGFVSCVEQAGLAGCAPVGTPAVSTGAPESEWRQGQMPYFYQTDEAWGDEPYAGGTVAENGCGPTALAMVRIDLLGGTKWDPARLAAWSERNGYVEGGATRWALMTEGAARLGLSSREVPAETTCVRAALQAGNPVMCVVGPGDFTTTGHFIVLSSLNDDGTVNVHDPNSAANSHKAWDLERVLAQCNNLWAFSAG